MERRRFLGSIVLPTALGAIALPRLKADASARVPRARADDRPPEEIARDEDFWFQVQQAFTVDRSDDQPEQRRRLPVAGGRAGGDEALPRPREHARPPTCCGGCRSRRRRPCATGLARLFGCDPRGDRDHAQRLREPRDLQHGLRPRARRRGPDDDAGLPAHAHDLEAARAARRDRAAADLDPACRARTRPRSCAASRARSRRRRA